MDHNCPFFFPTHGKQWVSLGLWRAPGVASPQAVQCLTATLPSIHLIPVYPTDPISVPNITGIAEPRVDRKAPPHQRASTAALMRWKNGAGSGFQSPKCSLHKCSRLGAG